jgi:CDP-diacylglycerol---serine O-phosphatidyltransferase
VMLIFFVSCGISRLARYNVTAAEIADVGGKVRYFEGTPIPSSLLLVALLGLCFYLGRIENDLPFGVVEIASLQWHPSSLMFFINGSAMISKTLKIPKL